MKILIFTNNYDAIGGVQQYTKNSIRALEELNQDFKIVLLKKSNLFYKFLFVIESFFKFIVYKPDLILCNHINFTPLALFYKKIFKTTYGFIAYGIDVWDLKYHSGLINSDFIISLSQYTKNKILENNKNLKTNIFVINPAIDIEKFKPQNIKKEVLSKYKLPSNKKIILTTCRLAKSEKYKGYDRVIQALPKILEQVPDTIYTVIGDGDDMEDVKKIIEELNLKGKVYLLGAIKNEFVSEILNVADLFVMPSKGEGFGIVFIEALACGVPVIAGNKDASKEALLNGELGILVDPDNVDEIAEAIIKVLKGEAPKHLYDKNYLRQKVIENFSFEVFKNRVKIFLESISK
jgi:glycosyltransferase involved in cell wall biosynthesis